MLFQNGLSRYSVTALIRSGPQPGFLWRGVHICNPSSGKTETAKSLGLTGQSSLLGESQASDTPCFKMLGGRYLRNKAKVALYALSLPLCVCACTCVCMCMHMCTPHVCGYMQRKSYLMELWLQAVVSRSTEVRSQTQVFLRTARVLTMEPPFQL